MHRALPAAVLTALVLSLSGCGNGDDAKASKAISDSLMKNSSSSKLLTMKRKDADCIGKGLVDKVGTDKLQKYGLLTKDNTAKSGINDVKMSATDAKSTTKVLFDCTDVEAMMESAITKSGSINAKVKACVTKALTEDNLRPMFDEIFQGKQDEATKALTGPITKCAAAGIG